MEFTCGDFKLSTTNAAVGLPVTLPNFFLSNFLIWFASRSKRKDVLPEKVGDGGVGRED